VAAATVIPLRVKAGDDASCLNLYQPQQPRVIGVPAQLVDRGGFVFAATTAQTPIDQEFPWRLLADWDTSGQQPIPVFLDQNTATYSLHLDGVGSIFTMQDGRGGEIELKVVGLLKNSIFQGDVIMWDGYFTRVFPEISGYRMFLIAKGGSDATVTALQDDFETSLSDYGFDVERTSDRLTNFMAVQNTYLSTFQTLGGLGLLLGTFGLATVQLRNVLERRGELALLRATGFRRRRLGELVMLENAALLCFGLGTGILAALVAILPNLLKGDASIPWLSLAGTLVLVLAVGLLAGMTAVRASLQAPLLEALRGK
jgi:putative ABC transport system permease protein